MAVRRTVVLLAALLAAALPAGCEEEPEAPAGDPAYDEAVRLLRRLESETLDSDFQDPRFDEVVAALERIPADSPRWSAAQERLHEIRQARQQADARRDEVARMVDTLRTRPGLLAADEGEQTPEEMHRKLVAGLGDRKRLVERSGQGRYMPTREQRLARARARVQNVENHIRFLEDGLRQLCGGVAPAAQDGSVRERRDCVARRKNLEKIERQLDEAREELRLLEGR